MVTTLLLALAVKCDEEVQLLIPAAIAVALALMLAPLETVPQEMRFATVLPPELRTFICVMVPASASDWGFFTVILPVALVPAPPVVPPLFTLPANFGYGKLVALYLARQLVSVLSAQ